MAVAEELSFTRAAERLHVVQSAVSAAIRSLERELGIELFERSSRRVRLSDAGEALLPDARRALAAATAARQAVEHVRDGLQGTVAIGTLQSTSLFDLGGLLRRYSTLYPNVSIRLRQSAAGSAGLAQELADGELDIAFLAVLGEPLPGILMREIAALPMAVICRHDHHLADNPSTTLEELSHAPLIGYPPGFGSQQLIDQAFAKAGLKPNIAFEVTDDRSAIDLVRAGSGFAVTLAPAQGAGREGLRILDVEGIDLTLRLSVGTSLLRPPGAAARAFLSELERTRIGEAR